MFGWFRRFAKLWGFALFCVFVVYVFRDVALPFVFAVLVAYILAPLVDRMARLRVAGRPFPRGPGGDRSSTSTSSPSWRCSSATSSPSCPADIARVFREAPVLFEKLNQEYLPKVGGLGRRLLRAPARRPAEPRRRCPSPRPNAPPAPGIVVEPLADGRYRLDMQGLNLEIRPGRGRRLPGRPRPGWRSRTPSGEGPLGALDQAVDRRAGEDHRVARAGGPWSSARSSSPG